MPFTLRRTKRTVRTVAVIDINSGSIGAALITTTSRDPLPVVHYTYRVPYAFQNEMDFERYSRSMLASLLDVGMNLQTAGVAALRERTGVGEIDEFLCVFASPWVLSQSKVLTVERDRPFTLTPSRISRLVERTEAQFETDAEQAHEPKIHEDAELLERCVIDTAVNGYHTAQPYNVPVTHAEIALFISLASAEVQMRVREVITKLFPERPISFHSFTLAAFSATRIMFPSEGTALLVEISGEVTDVSLVSDGVLLESRSFAYGKNNLIRSVAKAGNTIPEEAHTLITLHCEGGGAPTTAAAVARACERARATWSASLAETFASFGQHHAIPQRIFLAVDPDLATWFTDILEHGTELSPFAPEPFAVISLNGNEALFTDKKQGIRLKDPFLAVEAYFLHTLRTAPFTLQAP